MQTEVYFFDLAPCIRVSESLNYLLNPHTKDCFHENDILTILSFSLP